jgi:hypothetical protein
MFLLLSVLFLSLTPGAVTPFPVTPEIVSVHNTMHIGRIANMISMTLAQVFHIEPMCHLPQTRVCLALSRISPLPPFHHLISYKQKYRRKRKREARTLPRPCEHRLRLGLDVPGDHIL